MKPGDCVVVLNEDGLFHSADGWTDQFLKAQQFANHTAAQSWMAMFRDRGGVGQLRPAVVHVTRLDGAPVDSKKAAPVTHPIRCPLCQGTRSFLSCDCVLCDATGFILDRSSELPPSRRAP